MEERERYVHVRDKCGKLVLQLGNIISSKIPCFNRAWLIWSIQRGVVRFHDGWMNVQNQLLRRQVKYPIFRCGKIRLTLADMMSLAVFHAC